MSMIIEVAAPPPRWPHGFDLVEILVTIVLFAIGVLGLAGLQLRSLSDSRASAYRTIASQQAYDIADRIAANLAGVAAGYYDNLTATVPSNPQCMSSGCSVADMARTDHYQWLRATAAVLPAGTGTVRCAIGPAPTCVTNTPGSNRIFDVTVAWSERTADVDPARQFITRQFITRFAP